MEKLLRELLEEVYCGEYGTKNRPKLILKLDSIIKLIKKE